MGIVSISVFWTRIAGTFCDVSITIYTVCEPSESLTHCFMSSRLKWNLFVGGCRGGGTLGFPPLYALPTIIIIIINLFTIDLKSYIIYAVCSIVVLSWGHSNHNLHVDSPSQIWQTPKFFYGRPFKDLVSSTVISRKKWVSCPKTKQ